MTLTSETKIKRRRNKKTDEIKKTITETFMHKTVGKHNNNTIEK